MRERGIKASELIKQLQDLIEEHGDREVIIGGGDYPEPCRSVSFQTKRHDPYIPEGTFYL
ncbi:hypothetical protein [Cupriavidus campinensis]|uniref:Uncharacterized protein n=1 Tax=Cupriavidus campinensis TaxID=151783 RepID=A0ABY3ETM0_9BURK|nr:hypothetical protein [Cupriavidus campinensis]TSP14052.1 hypothetical protein FGG12_06165 [Cupriavidus campinensis]